MYRWMMAVSGLAACAPEPFAVVPGSEATSLAWDGTSLYLAADEGTGMSVVLRAEP